MLVKDDEHLLWRLAAVRFSDVGFEEHVRNTQLVQLYVVGKESPRRMRARIMTLGELDLNEAAMKAAGNWQDFNCFIWFRDKELRDAEKWAVIYTHNRDSGLLDQSNAAVIERELAPFSKSDRPDVVFESHSHWAVGHVDGFSVRVFRRGRITKAFRKYHELAEKIDNYPILDETDYSNREYEATVENIADAAWRLKHDYDLPEGWAGEVYSWLSDNSCDEIENSDDQGGYPSEEALKQAFEVLGYEPMEATASS